MSWLARAIIKVTKVFLGCISYKLCSQFVVFGTSKKEVRELAHSTEEARLRLVEEEQRALDTEIRAYQEFLDLVPNLGGECVPEQISHMREALKDDHEALGVALDSLYTLFEQIMQNQEEINFCHVRRDHPKFVDYISWHVVR